MTWLHLYYVSVSICTIWACIKEVCIVGPGPWLLLAMFWTHVEWLRVPGGNRDFCCLSLESVLHGLDRVFIACLSTWILRLNFSWRSFLMSAICSQRFQVSVSRDVHNSSCISPILALSSLQRHCVCWLMVAEHFPPNPLWCVLARTGQNLLWPSFHLACTLS